MPQPTRYTASALRNVLLIVTFLAGGTGVAGWLYAVRTSPPRRELISTPPLVKTEVVRAESVTERYTGFGTVQATAIARLAADVASTVVERVGDLREGRAVVAGQPIIRLDDQDYKHALDRTLALADADTASLHELSVEAERIQQLLSTAEVEYRVVTAELERVGGLSERELAAEKEMTVATLAQQNAKRVRQGYQRELALIAPRRERLEASHRAQVASAGRARLDVERCTIRAPIDGVIQSLNVDVGDRVGPGTPVATIVDARRVEVPIQLPASVYADVRPNAPCRIETESLPNASWSGVVARIAPTVDEATRTFSAYLVVDNRVQEKPLVPGMFVRAVVEGPTLSDALIVPRGAIREGQVFVARDGVARRETVVVSRLVVERAVVRGNLADGDRVIVSNLDVLTDGSPVCVSEAPAADVALDAMALDSIPDVAGDGAAVDARSEPTTVGSDKPRKP